MLSPLIVNAGPLGPAAFAPARPNPLRDQQGTRPKQVDLSCSWTNLAPRGKERLNVHQRPTTEIPARMIILISGNFNVKMGRIAPLYNRIGEKCLFW
jgi:hypothetical protein